MANKIDGNRKDFYQWPTVSTVGKGSDHVGRTASRKQHRSKRIIAADGKIQQLRLLDLHLKTNSIDLEGVNEAELRVREFWKLSNRRYRRWMNDRLLRELAPPMDAEEIGSLFAPPPWGEKCVHTPFERVTGIASDMAAWEPFRNNVDMDYQAHVLQPRLKQPRKKANKDSLMRALALASWRNVDYQARNALRRRSSWHLVEAFEERVVAFLRDTKETDTAVLELELEDSYHRLLFHGVSQFHGLASCTERERGEEERATTDSCMPAKIYVTKKNPSKLLPKEELESQGEGVSVLQFLKEANRQISCPNAGA